MAKKCNYCKKNYPKNTKLAKISQISNPFETIAVEVIGTKEMTAKYFF